MKIAPALLAVVVTVAAAPAVAAPASAERGFDEQKADAVTIERLSSTVASLVGVCPDGLMPDEYAECEKNLKAGAKGLAGKKIYLNMGGGLEESLAFDKTLPAGKARFVWTPLFDLGNELMLTVGRPTKLSPQGNVVMARRPVDGKVDTELLDSDLQRAAKTGQIGVELVGTFGKPWQLKGKKLVRGVAFEPKALRLFHTRTNKTLLEVTDFR
jgi:hypothetical protein